MKYYRYILPVALTYDNFRENAHRREGYAAREVPESGRVP